VKVLVATTLYPPFERGGAEHVARLTVQGLRRTGVDVTVLTATPFRGLRSLWPTVSLEDGVRVYRWYPANLYAYVNASRYPAWRRVVWTALDLCNLHSWLVARAVLRRERPDVVISHNLKGLGYSLARLFARRAPRYLHVLHDVQLLHPTGVLYPWTYGEVLRRPAVRVYGALTRWLFGTVPVVVSPSRFLLEFYRQRGFFPRAATRLVPNPTAPAAPAVPHDGVTVTFIGQLEASKGVDVLLAAWERADVRDATLHVVGEGSWRAAVAAAARAQNVVRHGYLTGSTLEAVWQRTDVLVLPSRCVENAPLVISEALARAVTIVASDVGGVRELTAQAAGATLVPPGDVAALGRALVAAVAARRRGETPTPVRARGADQYVAHLLR
jgi:glycosyltransferase involved in cell wall biosynthesis